MMNFGTFEPYGTRRIPTYKQYVKNMQRKFETMGAKMAINIDGSVTVEMNGKVATQPESAIKAKYSADVNEWKAKGFEF